MVCCWKIAGAQEIYDKDNRLFVAQGTLIHTVAATQSTPKHKKKSGVRIRTQKWMAKADKNTCKRVFKKEKARESVKPVTGFTDKETSTLSFRQLQYHYGMLVYPSYGKGRYAVAIPPVLTRIFSQDDIAKHKYLYIKSHRQFEISCHNSCRPPPDASIVHKYCYS